jgi:chromosomal replication initiator protein
MNAYIIPGVEVTEDIIISICEQAFNLKEGLSLKNTRTRDIKDARFMAMFFLHRWKRMRQAKVGFIFGRDHATVIHACSRIEGWIKYEKPIREKFMFIANSLGVSNQFIRNYAA